MGDFGSATETMRIIDLFALQIFAKKFGPVQLSTFETQSRLKPTCRPGRATSVYDPVADMDAHPLIEPLLSVFDRLLSRGEQF